MKQGYSLVYILFFAKSLLAQKNTSSITQYYPSNEAHSPAIAARLDSMIKMIVCDTAFVSISGYADFVGSAAANKILSERRAEGVKQYFLIRAKPDRVWRITTESFGEANSEENGSAQGEPLQRRVDVQISWTSKAATVPIVASPAKKAKEAYVPAENGLEKLTKGESMAIKDLSFFPGRHIWTPASEPALKNLLHTLEAHPELKIEIQGHICCIYTDGDALDFDTNEKKLSTNRALAVYDYLVSSGIDASRLQYKGYAHSMPRVKEERTSQDEQTNRRVEIKILDL